MVSEQNRMLPIEEEAKLLELFKNCKEADCSQDEFLEWASLVTKEFVALRFLLEGKATLDYIDGNFVITTDRYKKAEQMFSICEIN